ncbi:M23 family metallopeptidase [Methylobacterium sp. 37f]|nr:M23 family metallopeptidase [Methylobacterium sp. 37f]
MLVCGSLLTWAGAASWLAYDRGEATARVQAEQAAQRAAYEDKVRALTRRLVGVASHQILEHDGLAGRLSDIITRQVEIENRLAALSGYAKRLAEAPGGQASGSAASGSAVSGDRALAAVAATTANSAAETTRDAAPGPDVLRLGAPRSVKPSVPVPGTGPRSDLNDAPSLGSGAGDATGARVRALLALTPREQFDSLDHALDLAERAGLGILGSFGQATRAISDRIRTAVAGLGLSLPAVATARFAPPAHSPRGSSFEDGVQAFEAGFDELRRWRLVVETVPLRRPIEGLERALTSNFGTRSDPFTGAATMHAGMDFRAPVGTGVRASGAGKVVTAEITGGYGNLVEIDHGHGVVTRYAHLSSYAISTGQTVRPDTVVGMVGSTGRSTGPHLHYETRLNGTAIDPMRFLKVGAALLDTSSSVPASSAAAEASED